MKDRLGVLSALLTGLRELLQDIWGEVDGCPLWGAGVHEANPLRDPRPLFNLVVGALMGR